MSSISKISNASPVAFDKGFKQVPLQVKLIVDLLKDAISNEKSITEDDIRMLYAEWSMRVKRHRSGLMYDRKTEKWRYAQTKEEWLEKWATKYRAIPWFQKHLGSAILHGKILAIPIIEID